MNEIIDQTRYHIALADKLFARLESSHIALEPRPGMKTPGWLIGHLAVTGDFGRRLCGVEPVCPREWRGMFNPGSHPSHDPSSYPALGSLCDSFRFVYTDLCVTAPAADPALLARDNPVDLGRAHFSTAGAFVSYLMSGHLAYHLGQLQAWCAAV